MDRVRVCANERPLLPAQDEVWLEGEPSGAGAVLARAPRVRAGASDASRNAARQNANAATRLHVGMLAWTRLNAGVIGC
jgi:hypothetical protein